MWMQPFIHILPLNGDQFAIRQLLHPIAEGTLFVQFVILPALIDIKQYLIIKNNCPPLVVRRWEKLYQLPPYVLLTGDSRIKLPLTVFLLPAYTLPLRHPDAL